MITPFKVELVPSVFREEDAAEQVEAFCAGDIAAFAMHSEERNARNRFGIVDLLKANGMPYITEGSLARRTQPYVLGRPRTKTGFANTTDLPLHTDATWQGMRPLDAVSIRGYSGLALAHLFSPAETYIEAGRAHRSGHIEAHQLFELGRADTDITEPVDMMAVLAPGSELVMRADLFHYVQSVTFPRESMIRGIRSYALPQLNR